MADPATGERASNHESQVPVKENSKTLPPFQTGRKANTVEKSSWRNVPQIPIAGIRIVLGRIRLQAMKTV